MALNSKEAADRVIELLDGLGIDSEVDGKPSHTARLVQEIMRSIIQEIRSNGQVIVQTQVTTQGSPNFHSGKGFGRGTII